MFPRYFALIVALGALFGLTQVFIASADDPPLVPHAIEGRQLCTMCHTVGGIGVGVPGGIGMPNDHLNRPDSSCLSCHKASVAPATATSAPQAAAGSATAPLTSTLAASATPTVTVASAAVLTPTATAAPAKAQAALAAPAQPTAAPAASLPSAGEPLEDFARVVPFFAVGALLLLGAIAAQRLMGPGL